MIGWSVNFMGGKMRYAREIHREYYLALSDLINTHQQLLAQNANVLVVEKVARVIRRLAALVELWHMIAQHNAKKWGYQ